MKHKARLLLLAGSVKCKALRLNAAGLPPPNSCLLSVRRRLFFFLSGTSGNEKGELGLLWTREGSAGCPLRASHTGEEGAGNDCDGSEWSPGLQPLRHRKGGERRRRRFSSSRLLFSFSAHFSQFSCEFRLRLHSRTKQENNNVAFKASHTAGHCKHAIFSLFFHLPYFLVVSSMSSLYCRHRLELSTVSLCCHLACCFHALFSFFFSASEDRRGTISQFLYIFFLPPTTILPCLAFAQMILSGVYFCPALHHLHLVFHADPRRRWHFSRLCRSFLRGAAAEAGETPTIWSGQVWSGLVRSGEACTGLVRSGQVRSGLDWSGLVRSGEVCTGQVRSGLVWTGQVW